MLTREERAKQFMPFDALKGLKEAYLEKELEIEQRKDLSEDSKRILDEKLEGLSSNDKICVTYYKINKYINKIGRFKMLNIRNKCIIFEDKEVIKINDIIDIKLI